MAALSNNGIRVHLAERDPQHHAWAKRGVEQGGLRLRILLSYWYYKDADLDALFAKYFTPPYPDVFADSGGFSATTQGVEINWRDYAAWVRRWSHLFQAYANLDAIGNAAATLENQQRLEDAGLTPLPVFHVGETWDHLERYIDGYPYIALGGMVPYMRYREKIMPWLVKAFRMAQGQAVYHGFGSTSWIVIASLPWYSVDSSSWRRGIRFGQPLLFDEKRGRFVEARLGDKKTCYQHAGVFHALGFDPADFADRARNDRAKICAVSALSYMKAEQFLRKRHGEIYIPGCEAAPAVLRARLADANPARYGEAVAGAGDRLHLSDTSNGINFRDANKGLHLADARPGRSSDDLATAAAGLKVHLVAGSIGDTSRAMEVLNRE